jgi:CheY-like chemotaxis protein
MGLKIPRSMPILQQQKKILLIDDDHDHLLVCNLILRQRGYGVFTMEGCESMEDLTAVVEVFGPDLIFMDHDMRGICGADLTRMLKSHTKFYRIPVIYFSGREDIAELARRTRADGHLAKPFEVESLVRIADEFLA